LQRFRKRHTYTQPQPGRNNPPHTHMEIENETASFDTAMPGGFDEVCLAAWNSNLKVLGGLMDQVKRGGQSSTGYGPTHFAASLGNVEVMEFLLASGVDKNERDADGNSPLMWVVSSNGSDEMMDCLVDNGANVNQQNFNGETALFVACDRGSVDKVEYLLENAADANVANIDGASPLHAAAARGDGAVIALLVRYGACVNAVDEEGDMALHWAVREGKVDAVQALVQLGARMELRNEDGETALDLALSLDDELMVKHLLLLGAKEPRNRLPALIVTTTDGCASADDHFGTVEEVRRLGDKDDVSMMDVAKDLRGLSVSDDWRAARTVSL